MFLERVAERVSSLSKLKSVLVTDSHAQLLQRPCSATYGHEQRRRRLPSSSGDALPEGWTVNSVRVVPSAPGRRCPPTYCQELGAIHLLATCWCAPTFLAQVLVPVGRQPAARQGFARDGERRPRTARSLGARARQRRNPARLAGRQRLIGLRAPFRRSGKEETCTHAHMHMYMYMCMLYSDGNSARDNTQTRGHAAMS